MEDGIIILEVAPNPIPTTVQEKQTNSLFHQHLEAWLYLSQLYSAVSIITVLEGGVMIQLVDHRVRKVVRCNLCMRKTQHKMLDMENMLKLQNALQILSVALVKMSGYCQRVTLSQPVTPTLSQSVQSQYSTSQTDHSKRLNLT